MPGTLAGAILGAMFRRIGVSGAAALVLLMPVATTLDPTTGLVLLGACLTASLVVTTRHDPEATMTPHHNNIALVALLAGLVVLLASASAAALLQAATPADTIALLACGAAAAVVLAAATHPAGWTAALTLTLGGIALQLSPLRPLDTEHTSPLPLLFGLLVLGPAVVALTAPRRTAPWSSAFGGIELAATVLPAFLIGIPATRGISVFALDLGENGLNLGPKLMTQRPKLVLGFVLALLVAGLIGMAVRLTATRLPRINWRPNLSDTATTCIDAAIIVFLSLVALYFSGVFSGVDASRAVSLLTLLVTMVAGAAAAWFGWELAPLVTGLVIGQLMLQPLQAALGKANGSAVTAITSGSSALLVFAILVMAATLAWPLWARRASR